MRLTCAHKSRPTQFGAALTLVLLANGCGPFYTEGDLNGPRATYAAAHTIAAENEKPGTADWQIINPAKEHEIEGYASAASVTRGQDIELFVNTAEPTYSLEIFRMGWYGGLGARLVRPRVVRAGVAQPPPQVNPATHLVECGWRDPYMLHVPASDDVTDWASGIYLARLTAGTSAKQSYIIFVVRDDQRRSDLLFQSSVTTFQAYNDWGGFSLYTRPRGYKVSFNRPYRRGDGAGDFLEPSLHWEYNMLRFLEREGYDVTYTTDIDTHARGHLLLEHRAFLSVGHDEYWSWEMRNNVEAARNRGLHLGFFGSNVSYWQIRLEPSPATGTRDRTVVGYKKLNLDPISHDPFNDYRSTVRFRSRPVRRSEDAMVGVQFEFNSIVTDVVVDNPAHWVWEGTGVAHGDHLTGLLGNEVDRIYGHTPAAVERVAHSPYQVRGRTLYGDMSVYEMPSGAVVFATGSMSWNHGLDGYPDNRYVSAPAQQATRNVLRRFGAEPHGASNRLAAAMARSRTTAGIFREPNSPR